MPGRVMSSVSDAELSRKARRQDEAAMSSAFAYLFLNDGLDFVDPLSHVAFGFFRRCLQPEIIDLGEYAVLARHPAVAEGLPVGFILDGRGFLLQSGQAAFRPPCPARPRRSS